MIVLGAFLTGVYFLFLESPGKLSCVKEHKIFFRLEASENILSIPLVSAASIEKIPFLEFVAGDETWKMTALYSESVGALMAEFSSKNQSHATPLLLFVQDASGEEYLLMKDKNGGWSLSPLSFLLEQSFLVSKQNFLGYTPKKDGAVVCYFQQQNL